MSQKHSQQQDVITLSDVAQRIPAVVKKLPHVVKGLYHAYDPRPNKAVGLGWGFEKATRDNPYGVALYYQDTLFTYTQLNEWANRIAHYFLQRGLKKGDVAAVIIENRPELLATVLGLAKIGVISALVNTSQTGKSLEYSINLVNPKAVIAGDEAMPHLNEVKEGLKVNPKSFFWLADQNTYVDPGTAPAGMINLAQAIQNSSSFNPPTTDTIRSKDGLFYIYTSGTTGLPKAVVFNHGRWMTAYGTYGHIMNLNEDDVLYATLPLYHATGMVICWGCTIAGASGFAIRRKFSASQFWNDVRKYDASAIGYVGELCRYLMDMPPSPDDRKHRVRKMIGNGMRSNIWSKFKKRFGIDEVFEFYASSEGNVGFSNIFNFENTVGFSNIPYAVVKYDKDTNQPVRDQKGFMSRVKTGESGLLIGKITSRSPFDGYSDPEKNKAVILTDVFEKGDRYFNTGDLVRDIGYWHAQFVDRTGDTFRWKGENVSTTEVEGLIAENPKITDAVVYGVEIPETNGRAGMAAITPADGQTFTEADYPALLADFKSKMPSYAVPVFLRLQKQVQTTGTFKYQKNDLKKEHYDPAQTSDPLLVWLPGTETYSPLTPEIYQNIQAKKYRF